MLAACPSFVVNLDQTVVIFVVVRVAANQNRMAVGFLFPSSRPMLGSLLPAHPRHGSARETAGFAQPRNDGILADCEPAFAAAAADARRRATEGNRGIEA
jgi:hypothetical protein